MADKPIKVAVLEGDFASLCSLGFPISLSLQLQQSCLRLSDAMWTAKSTQGGFSVSFFWPAPDPVKCDSQPKRKRRRRAKTSKVVSAVNKLNDKVNSEPPAPSHVQKAICTQNTPNDAPHVPLTSPSSIHYDEKGSNQSDAKTGTDTESETEQQWTKVTTRKRRKVHLPPCWKLKVPVHLCANLHSPSDSTEETDDESRDIVDVPQCAKLTPVAARTRSKRLKNNNT